MNDQAEVRKLAKTPMAMTLSEDGYVRLTFESLSSLPLYHLLSGLDEDNVPTLQEGAVLTVISGYTEWISATKPVITLGWDWQLLGSRGQPLCVRVSQPRCNIMLLDAQQCDLESMTAARLIETTIDRLPWQDVLLKTISHQCA